MAGDLPQISDEMVEAFLRASLLAEHPHLTEEEMYKLLACDKATSGWEHERAGLAAALTASGWRPETDVRAEIADDLTRFADRRRERAYQFAAELAICDRRTNDCVTNSYYLAAAMARNGNPCNVHCANCGDTRGGPLGHETSECRWDPCNASGEFIAPTA